MLNDCCCIADYDVSYIIKEYEKNIKKSLRQTDFNLREDLEQELKLIIIERIPAIKSIDAPGFWEFKSKFD